MKNNSVLLTQIVGLVVLGLAMFGIDVSPEDQANILAGLSSAGLVITAIMDKYQKSGGQPQ